MSANPLPRYGLFRPTMGEALVAVYRAHGVRAGEVWRQLLADAGLAGDETDDAALERLMQAMTLDPVSAVIARSLRIRIATYNHLAAAHAHVSAAQASARGGAA